MRVDLLLVWAEALLKPFYRVIVAPPQQWHPLLIHFPLVFLTSEACLMLWYGMTRKSGTERWAYTFLKAGCWSLLPVVAAGVHDCGLALGPGNTFLLGVQDRLENAFRFESSVTVHVWLAGLLLVLTFCRLLWRWRRGPQVWQGPSGYWYGGLTGFGIWCLLAMSYVGGLISHR